MFYPDRVLIVSQDRAGADKDIILDGRIGRDICITLDAYIITDDRVTIDGHVHAHQDIITDRRGFPDYRVMAGMKALAGNYLAIKSGIRSDYSIVAYHNAHERVVLEPDFFRVYISQDLKARVS